LWGVTFLSQKERKKERKEERKEERNVKHFREKVM
jgi:hypothetical protein